jgi:hypothetical protein
MICNCRGESLVMLQRKEPVEVGQRGIPDLAVKEMIRPMR